MKMLNAIALKLICVSVLNLGFLEFNYGQKAERLYEKANKLYSSNKKGEALKYYKKASELNSINAHLKIVEEYNVTIKDVYFHLQEASKLGSTRSIDLMFLYGIEQKNKNKLENAQKFLELAANYNHAEAHYSLGYEFYSFSTEKKVFHLVEASNLGHEKAVKEMLEILFYRAKNIRTANPKLAYITFKKALKVNPNLGVHYSIETLRKCVEVPDFDLDAFIKKYNIKDVNYLGGYDVWKLAEEASKGAGRFRDSDPNLVFQLVMRGGFAPAEMINAVDDIYPKWKKGIVETFKICDYTTSSYGTGYCAGVRSVELEIELEHNINKLAMLIDAQYQVQFMKTIQLAFEFIDYKTLYEEQHGGRGREQWRLDSNEEQKREYLKLITQLLINGDELSMEIYNIDYEGLQNIYFKMACNRLKKYPIDETDLSINVDQMKKGQQHWLNFRNSSAQLINYLTPHNEKEEVMNYLNKKRINDLQFIIEFNKNY